MPRARRTTPLSARTVDNSVDTTVHTTVDKTVAGRTVVTCRLEGTFPGSPVDLDYRFDLDDAERISRLEIVVSRPAPETAMEVTG
ncbi:hypothetical protein [Microbispora sp. H13382]|uniref:hypothetical protein n=1 Tax=Microbispora sp. H13382 TaxID=2729112 RepID=UPI0015FFCA14|nr:hypothetical protein [Microbispora sp. H13382]